MGKTKRQKGGADSAWSYVYDTVGSGLTQFKNALTLQPGENLATIQSLSLIHISEPTRPY